MKIVLRSFERIMREKKQTVSLLLAMVIILIFATYLPSKDFRSFKTPDENYQYLLMKEYANHGRLFLARNYSVIDVENLLHPRQFVTFNNKIVPFNYVGLPVIYAPFYVFLGEKVKLVLPAIFAILLYSYLTKIAISLFGEGVRHYTWVGFIACTPVIYYLNYPFFNFTLAFVFFTIGLYYLLLFNRYDKNKYLVLSFLFYSISIFVRYHYILFVLLMFAAVSYTNSRKFMLNFLKFMNGILFIGLLPIMWINAELYGDPLLVGYTLINLVNEYKPYTNPFESTPLKYLFPYPIIPEFILKNVVRLIVFFEPALFIFCLVGLVSFLKENLAKLHLKKVLLSTMFISYLIIFTGSSPTWRSFEFEYIGFDISIIRYWILLYIFMSLFLINGIKKIKDQNRLLFVFLVTFLIINSNLSLFVTKGQNLIDESWVLKNQDGMGKMLYDYLKKKEGDNLQNVVVYTDFGDKILSPLGLDVATWWPSWQQPQVNYNPEKISASMVRIHEYGKTVYIIKTKKYINVEELNRILQEKGYELVIVLRYDEWEVFKLVRFRDHEISENKYST